MSEDIRKFDILFVEDEKAIRDNYVRYLKRYFQNVYEAEDGEEAYEIYKEKKPHILIVDLNIPKLNGLELLAKIRQSDHSVKAIILTAHTEAKFLIEATSLKLTKYLVKPVNRSALKNALDLAILEFSNFDVVSKNCITLKENFSWDINNEELINKESSILLTNKERKILAMFFKNINKTMTYDDMVLEVWYDYEEDKIDALKTIIKNLRKKLPKDTIINVFGIGYKVEV